MNFKPTQKEKMLLQDQQKHEQICIKKYHSYASQAQTPELKQLFQTHAAHEEQHLNTINQLLQGQIPNVSQQSGGQQQQQQQINLQAGQQPENQMEAYLCNDLLDTEKYVSSTYDTAIFECTNPQVRQVLNHIQKEEQKHGEDIFLYMQSHGMYNPQ